ALEDVGAARLLAHRVEAGAADQGLELRELRTDLGLRLDPVGLLLDGGLRVAGFDAEELPTFWCECHSASLRVVVGWSCGQAVMCCCRSAVRRSATSAGVTMRPSSCVSEVTPASAMPQGTIASNPSDAFEQLRANPCIVTPSWMRIPIAAILRVGPCWSACSQTPARSSIVCAVIPYYCRSAM